MLIENGLQQAHAIMAICDSVRGSIPSNDYQHVLILTSGGENDLALEGLTTSLLDNHLILDDEQRSLVKALAGKLGLENDADVQSVIDGVARR